MKLQHLDDLDQLSDLDDRIRGEWIKLIPNKDLYKIGIWLLTHLGPNRFNTNHDRTRLRDICESYYITRDWTDKQKFYLGHGIISLWSQRQLDKDPRYLL